MSETNTTSESVIELKDSAVCETSDSATTNCETTSVNKTTKRKSRSVEVLENIRPRSMSDAEMRNYIEFLRSERNYYKGQALAYENNSESAFKVAHAAEDNAKRKIAEITGKLEFAKQAISTCYASILYASKGE